MMANCKKISLTDMKLPLLFHSVLLSPDTGKRDEPCLPNGGAIAQHSTPFYVHNLDILIIGTTFIFYDFYTLWKKDIHII